MKCLTCGTENSAEAKFCKNCGQQLVKKEKKKNKVLFGIYGFVVLAAIVIGIFMDYEKAEAEYLKAIEIEPKQEEPYVLLADLYVAWMKPEKAKEIIEQGMQKVAEKHQVKLPEKLNEVEKYIEFTWVVEPTTEADDIYYVKRDGPKSYNESQQQFMKDHAVIKKGDTLGLIGLDGEIAGNLDYSEITCMRTYYSLVRTEFKYESEFNSDWLLYTLDEGEIIPTTFGFGDFDNMYYYYQNQLKNVLELDPYEVNSIPTLIDPIPIQSSDSICEYSDDWYQINGAYAIYSDEQLATDFIYEQCGSYSEGLMAVMKDGKWGYVDGQGEVVIPLKYDATWEQYEESYESGQIDYCYAATEGFLILRQDDKWELCDLAGNVVIPSGYFEAIRPVCEGKCWVKKDGKWGVIKVAEAAKATEAAEATEAKEADETTEANETTEADKTAESTGSNIKYYQDDTVELTGVIQIVYDEELDKNYTLLKLDTPVDFEVNNMEGVRQEYKNCDDIQITDTEINWSSLNGKRLKVKGNLSNSGGTYYYCRSYVINLVYDTETLE